MVRLPRKYVRDDLLSIFNAERCRYMAAEIIAIASDHAGVGFKESLKTMMSEAGRDVLDLGTNSPDSVDYPDFANVLTSAIGDGSAERGVLICGTGIGMSIAANRKRFIRAALCHSATDARFARRHNDANVLILGARTLGIEIARDCLGAFLDTEFEGGRHQRRVDKMSG